MGSLPPSEQVFDPSNLFSDSQSAKDLRSSIAKSIESEKPKVDSTATAERDEFDKARLEELVKDLQQDRTLRKDYATKIYRLSYMWLLGVWVILIADLGLSAAGFQVLDGKVLEVLLGATTIKVIGLIWLVTRYLFHSKRLNSSDQKS